MSVGLLRLHPCENNSSAKLVHVMLLQMLELSRVTVDPPALGSSFLRFITTIHLCVIITKISKFSCKG